jgi:Ca2+/H+ antiporter, TMEM165/GDT1 family
LDGTLVLFTAALTAAAEIGDKSQLMSLLLGMRFRRPALIIVGIFVAAIASNGLAALAGHWLAAHIAPTLLRWALVLLFLAVALWMALPDDFSSDGVLTIARGGIVLAPAISFFVAELGDKSELAIASLSAKYDSLVAVMIGGIAGMMLANVPVVLFGALAGQWIAQPAVRYVGAGGFALLALLTALGIPL